MTAIQIHIRHMLVSDIADVCQVQALAYAADFHESAAVLQRKLELAPDYCWVAERAGEVVGYLFSHPWQGMVPPRLHYVIEALPENLDTWFIHDMALAPAARGQNMAAQLLQQAQEHARLKAQYSLLIAMPGVDGFWKRQGYEIVENLLPEQLKKLSGYGPGARLMQAGQVVTAV